MNKDKKQGMAKKMPHILPEISARENRKVMSSIAKKGVYESPAYKKSQVGKDKKWESYTKERSERYKRDGITE